MISRDSRGFEVGGFFPSGYLPATNGGKIKNSLKYCIKKIKKNVTSCFLVTKFASKLLAALNMQQKLSGEKYTNKYST